jgi:hypothetical protein
MSLLAIVTSVLLLYAAGLGEVSGGYLVWLVTARRKGRPRWGAGRPCALSLRRHPDFAACPLWSLVRGLRWGLRCVLARQGGVLDGQPWIDTTWPVPSVNHPAS